MKGINQIGRRAAAGAGLLVLIVMVLDFNSRMAELTRLRTQKDIEATKYQVLVVTQSGLETQMAYATSDAAVGEWARQESRKVLPGDRPIIPIPDGESTPAARANEFVEVTPVSNWQAWMQWLFFDSSP